MFCKMFTETWTLLHLQSLTLILMSRNPHRSFGSSQKLICTVMYKYGCMRTDKVLRIMHTTFFSPAKLCQWHSIFRLLRLCTHLLPQHDLHIERKHVGKWMEWMRLKLYSKSPNLQNLTRPCYGLCHPKLGITQVCACSIERKYAKSAK